MCGNGSTHCLFIVVQYSSFRLLFNADQMDGLQAPQSFPEVIAMNLQYVFPHVQERVQHVYNG